MSKVKVELNHAGVGQILRGTEMRRHLESVAASIASRAGSGYAYRSHDTGQRTIVNVYPDTAEAARENAASNTLLKAMR